MNSMNGKNRIKTVNLWTWMILLIGSSMLVTACASPADAVKSKPSEITPDGRIKLLQTASDRTGIQTGEITTAEIAGKMETVVPYSAVMYGLNGETWVYTIPEPLTFANEAVVLGRIEGEFAVLLEGPPVGTAVVTVGAAELFGAETGIGK